MSLFEFGGGSDEAARSQLKRIEAKMDAILKHLQIAFEWPVVSDEVRSLAQSGKVIRAIKVHREQTGAGLAEAKQLVESLGR